MKQLLSAIDLSSVLHAVATADTYSSTWHAGWRIAQRPFWCGLLKSSRDFGIGFFVPAPLRIGLDHLPAVGTIKKCFGSTLR